MPSNISLSLQRTLIPQIETRLANSRASGPEQRLSRSNMQLEETPLCLGNSVTVRYDDGA